MRKYLVIGMSNVNYTLTFILLDRSVTGQRNCKVLVLRGSRMEGVASPGRSIADLYIVHESGVVRRDASV